MGNNQEIIPIALTKPCLYLGVRLRHMIVEGSLLGAVLMTTGLGLKGVVIGILWYSFVHAGLRTATMHDLYLPEIVLSGIMRPRKYQAHRLVDSKGAEPKPSFKKGHINLTGSV